MTALRPKNRFGVFTPESDSINLGCVVIRTTDPQIDPQ